MNTYYAYTRVSTVKQGEGASLEAQKEAIMAYAQKHDLNISDWFEEKETAAKDTRPVFNKMIKDLKRGRAKGLIVHKIDRSARNFKDWAKIGDLVEAGIAMHFAHESLDLNSRGGRLAADIQAVVAADYIRNLREESIKGQQMRLKQGHFPYKAPLGYLDNGKAALKTICPVRGPLVKLMFELYASGNYSMRSLAVEIHARGLTTWKDKMLTKTSVEQMLRNPFYAGIIKIRKTGKVYEGAHEPLITQELFDTVTKLRKGGRTSQKFTRHNYMFRGLWRCGLCKSAMTPEKQKGHIYYRCHRRDCETKCIAEEQIEASILTMLKNHCLTEKLCKELETRILEHGKNGENAQAEIAANHELKRLELREDRLNEKYLDAMIEDETFNKMKLQILESRQKWQSILYKSQKKTVDPEKLHLFLERAKTLNSSYIFGTPSEKREIVKFTTSNRRVFRKHVELEPQNWLGSLRKPEVSLIVRSILPQIELF